MSLAEYRTGTRTGQQNLHSIRSTEVMAPTGALAVVTIVVLPVVVTVVLFMGPNRSSCMTMWFLLVQKLAQSAHPVKQQP